MNHTHELRVHRRTHQLNQDELAHLIGVSSTMVLRMEKGAEAQLADIEAMLGLEVVFGKPLSRIFSALYAAVEDAVMRRSAELVPAWQALDDSGAKTKLALIDEIIKRATGTPDAA